MSVNNPFWSVAIEASPAEIWAILTNFKLMTRWMGDPEMAIEIQTDWTVGSSIFIRGFHHTRFENKGIILAFESGERLCYSHLSSLSRLPDIPESYSVLNFVLTAMGKQTLLTLTIESFPTEAIRKHLEFYWRTTIHKIKKCIEVGC